MSDIYDRRCVVCHEKFQENEYVVHVERVLYTRDSRIETTNKGLAAHHYCPTRGGSA